MTTSRRNFLKAASALTATLPFGANLIARSAAAQAMPNDYKALVCVFLYGGNDNSNTVIPYDQARYDKYFTARGGVGGVGGVGLERTSLDQTIINASGQPSTRYALNPGMKELAKLYRQGKMAVLPNVGTLVEPTVCDANDRLFRKGTSTLADLPPRLRSHNDQQAYVQSFGIEGQTHGWGGRVGDTFLDVNGDQSIFTSVSTSGAAVFSAGTKVRRYQVVAPSGAIPVEGLKNADLFGSVPAKNTLRNLFTAGSTRLFDAELNATRRRSLNAEAKLTGALPAPLDPNPFPLTALGFQLGLVARMIQAGRSAALGLKRQVFIVGFGSFDMHDDLDTQAGMLGEVDGALAAFHAQMDALNLGEKVTSFTASDFGRTLSSNGNGSDHGWGSHHFVTGGAVLGGKFYGQMPDVGNTDPNEMRRGVLVPTTSFDQVAWTLARWFGVPAADRDRIAPNLQNFASDSAYPLNLGFMG